MSPTPRVSVCIPTYKGGATIGAAIESVLAQSLTDFELVVIDDNSPDDTAAIVAGYRDPRLRYIRNERNLGPEGNWNRCLAETRGEYFKLLPHDDLLETECLARQAAVLDADTEQSVALVFSARHVLGPDGRALMRRGYPADEGRVSAAAAIKACVRRGTNLLGEPGAVMMRRALAQRVGPFDARRPYVIDLDYWFRLLAHGDAWYLAQPLASFRVSSQQWSVVLARKQGSDFSELVASLTAASPGGVTKWDRRMGQIAASFNQIARQVFYLWVLPRGRS